MKNKIDLNQIDNDYFSTASRENIIKYLVATDEDDNDDKISTDNDERSISQNEDHFDPETASREGLINYLEKTDNDLEKTDNDLEKTESPPSVAARFGRGAKSGLYKLGMALENAAVDAHKTDPEFGFSILDPEGAAHKEMDKAREEKHAKRIEKIKPLLSEDDWLHTAGEWAGETAALAPLGILGKGTQAVYKGASSAVKGAAKLAAKYGKTVAGAGALGGANQATKNTGANPLAVDLATLFTPAGKEVAKKGFYALAGYSPRKLNVELYDKALKEGIELPSTVTSDSKIRRIWDAIAKHHITAGRQFEKRNEKLHRNLFEQVNDVASNIGSKKDATFRNVNEQMYASAKEAAKGKTVTPNKVIDRLKQLAKEESTEGRSTSFEKELAKELSILHKNGQPKETSLEALINRIKDTNDKIYDLSRGSNERRQQSALKNTYKEQFEDFAKSSPEAAEWYKKFSKANKHHSKAQLREEFEKIFSKNLAEEIPEHFDLRKASKAFKNNSDVIEDVVKYTPEQRNKLDLLKNIFEEIEKKGSKIKNPQTQNELLKTVSNVTFLFNKLLAIPGFASHIVNSNGIYRRAMAAARQPNTLTLKNLAKEISKTTGRLLAVDSAVD